MRSPGSEVIELSHVVFAQDGYPTSGEWKQRFPISGCGNDTTLNFYFSATAGEKVNTTVGIPGETRADLRLQRDAQRYAIIGAGLVAKSCGNFDILHSTFDGTETPSSKLGILPRKAPPPWSETWILQGCGKRVAVSLRFVPDATGTQIIQHTAQELH